MKGEGAGDGDVDGCAFTLTPFGKLTAGRPSPVKGEGERG